MGLVTIGGLAIERPVNLHGVALEACVDRHGNVIWRFDAGGGGGEETEEVTVLLDADGYVLIDADGYRLTVLV